MPAIDISGCCIPAECDNIKKPYNGEIASRWDAYLLCDICRHFASVMLHFASLILHNLRCIPAYAHQIPTGFIQLLLNNHRDNLYIISQIIANQRDGSFCLWLGLESSTPHHQRRSLQRGRWHRQKDKNHSPSAKNPVGT